MSFAYPAVLWLLLAVPVWAWWRYAPRRRASLQFSDDRPLQRLPRTWAVHAFYVLPVLFGLGAACIIVALARPRKGLEESRVRTEAVDIILLVDVSTSMEAEDLSLPGRTMNRLEAAKAVAEQFIKARPNDRIGIVVFAAMPYTLAPLTLDHGWLIQQLGRMRTGMVEDGTAIGDGIAAAVNRLRDSQARSKVIILLTDGINNRGLLTPQNAAEAAKALGIRIYAVGAGGEGPARVPVMTPFGRRYVYQPVEIDEAMLRYIAQTTGGVYMRAKDFRTLEEIYRQIDRMEKTEIETEYYTRFEERFMPWVVAALVFLALERLLGVWRLDPAAELAPEVRSA